MYLVEAYTCSTRRYLTNAIQSPNEVEEYLEQLRQEPPVVTWKVRCFHYARPYWLAFISTARSIFKTMFRRKPAPDNNTQLLLPKSTSKPKDDGAIVERPDVSGPFKRKVVSHEASVNYTFGSFADATIAGVWRRQRSVQKEAAPFMKLLLSKILILANEEAKNDYFKQQSKFVSAEGMRDQYAEYSTNIEGMQETRVNPVQVEVHGC